MHSRRAHTTNQHVHRIRVAARWLLFLSILAIAFALGVMTVFAARIAAILQ